MSIFKIGDRVRVIEEFDGTREFAGREGIVVLHYREDGYTVGVDFGKDVYGYSHSLRGKLPGNTGYYGHDVDLELVETNMDSTIKARLGEIGDALIEKKAPLSGLTVTTEYRSSMAASEAIRPSMTVRLGRPLTVQGIRIY